MSTNDVHDAVRPKAIFTRTVVKRQPTVVQRGRVLSIKRARIVNHTVSYQTLYCRAGRYVKSLSKSGYNNEGSPATEALFSHNSPENCSVISRVNFVSYFLN